MVITPLPHSQNVFDFIFYRGDSNTQKKLETMVLKIIFG